MPVSHLTPSPSPAGQIELLKLSFFPAVFAAAPGMGGEGGEGQGEGEGGGDWALEYAGAVRNML